MRRDGHATLVLTGWPGIGKTTLWEACVDVARAARLGVLSARPSDAEARLVFGALIDVLDGVRSEELGHLPAPQLEALEVALLRRAAYADGAATWLETVATRSGAAEDGR